jgi:hypothetical protein
MLGYGVYLERRRDRGLPGVQGEGDDMSDGEKRSIYDIYLDFTSGAEISLEESRRLNKFFASNKSISEYSEPVETPKGVGRPPKYNSSESMQDAIDEYFNAHKPRIRRDENGNPLFTAKGMPIIDMNPPTISGLALFLGFSNRTSLYEYEKEPEFSDTIKRARTRCEEFVESGGMSGDVPAPMAIFALKNYGWSDKQELEHTGKDGGPVQVDYRSKISEKLIPDDDSK